MFLIKNEHTINRKWSGRHAVATYRFTILHARKKMAMAGITVLMKTKVATNRACTQQHNDHDTVKFINKRRSVFGCGIRIYRYIELLFLPDTPGNKMVNIYGGIGYRLPQSDIRVSGARQTVSSPPDADIYGATFEVIHHEKSRRSYSVTFDAIHHENSKKCYSISWAVHCDLRSQIRQQGYTC